MGSREGALKARQKQIEKYGSYEAYREYLRTIASKGGANGTGHTFSFGAISAKEAGAKGNAARARNKAAREANNG